MFRIYDKCMILLTIIIDLLISQYISIIIFAIFCFAEEVPMRYNALESSGISMAAA